MPHRVRMLLATAIAAALLGADACARVLRSPATPTPPEAIAQLWQTPDDLPSRDLFLGAGGKDLTPPATPYTFVAHKTTGTNPGYDVRDAEGRTWSVKLGEEAQAEVVVSRILWAVGFHQPVTYFVEKWTLEGGDTATPPAGRFRVELPEQKVISDWSWYENPFIGSRQFGALIAANVLLANWDLKTTNNKVYEVTRPDGSKERRYMVRDLGASLGASTQPAFISWLGWRWMQGPKNDIDAFERHEFIKSAEPEHVELTYRGPDQSLVKSVSPQDVRWVCELLARLSDRQLADAFRAAGYDADVASRYVKKIREKIAQGTAL